MRHVQRTLFLLLMFSASATAHHSHASIDQDKPITLEGTIAKFMWRMPHVYVLIDAEENGEIVRYTVETLNPPSLARVGWAKDSFSAGDRVVMFGHHDRDPDRAYASVGWMQKEGGPRMFTSAKALQQYRDEQQISAAVGEDRGPVEPATEFPGGNFWSRVSPTGGRFEPYRFPPQDWPYTEKAQALVDQFHESQNPINDCKTVGPPRAMLMPMSHTFYREGDDKILIDRDLWDKPRVIHLNPDAPTAPANPWGHSTGYFDGDVLVVETTNFSANRWGLRIGVDSSAQKHLLERYWLSQDGMMLHLEFTVTDPAYLTEPVTMTHQWGKVATTDLMQVECSAESANFFITAGYEDE
jgi:hypothetical protein